MPKIPFQQVGLSLVAVLALNQSCQKELSCPDCSTNQPPIAIAGPDQQTRLPKDSVILDGAASYDPEGPISSWQWTKISGPAGAMIIRAGAATTTVSTLQMGVYLFELTVSDNLGLMAKDTVQIIAVDPSVNQSPIANAGADIVVLPPADSVVLNGTASFDPDGFLASYSWTKLSGAATIQLRNTRSVQTVAAGLLQGVSEFELTVTDNGGLSAKDTIQVTITGNTSPPGGNCSVPDIVITLPTNTVTLAYQCPWDYSLRYWAWTKVAGPSSFVIASPNNEQTSVSDLVQGIYLFELKITDFSGQVSRDTVQVTVLPATTIVDCNGIPRQQVMAQLVPAGNLSQTRTSMAVAAGGNKIVFAGGINVATNQASSRVDILDLQTSSWSTAELSNPIVAAVTAVINNKIFFAGAIVNGELSSTVDIYDVITNSWSVTNLPDIGRRDGFFIGMINAAAAGNKVLFVHTKTIDGSMHTSYNLVDIFDISTNTWRTDTLHNRTHSSTGYTASDAAISTTTIGNKIYLAGNASDWFAIGYGTISGTIDIYDAGTGNWTSSTLTEARGGMGAIAIGNKNYWAGGVNNTSSSAMWTNKVEIRDMISGTSTHTCLVQANAFFAAVEKNNKIIFFTSSYGTGSGVPNNARNKFDIYDLSTNTWSVGILPVDIYASSVISVNNTIYVAGGKVNSVLSNKVYKLEF